MEKLVVYISGSSGVGKNTIINSLIEKGEDVSFLISYTTRPMREKESMDKPYHFVSKEEFLSLLKDNKILECDEYNGNYYGHCLDSIDNGHKSHRAVIKDLTVSGVMQSIEKLNNKYKIVPIFLTEKKSVLKGRLIGRGEKQIKSRLGVYKKEQALANRFKYIVENNKVARTSQVISSIIENEYNDSMVLCIQDCKKITDKQVTKVQNRIEKGKKIKQILCAEKDGKLYIVSGAVSYLAGLKTNKLIGIKMIEKSEIDINFDQSNWQKLVKMYKRVK